MKIIPVKTEENAWKSALRKKAAKNKMNFLMI